MSDQWFREEQGRVRVGIGWCWFISVTAQNILFQISSHKCKHNPTPHEKDAAVLHAVCRRSGKDECTHLDVGLLRLHQLVDDLAEFVGVGELSLSGRARRGRQGRHWARGEGRRGGRGGGRHRALQGVHVMETSAEGGNLLRALRRNEITSRHVNPCVFSRGQTGAASSWKK